MALSANKIIQFRDRVTDASVYPIGRMEIVFDSSGYNLNTYITEYNVNAHDDGANSGNNYMSDNVYTLEQAIAMLPPEYKRAGIKLTFKSIEGFKIYRSYDGIQFDEVNEDVVEPFIRGIGADSAVLRNSSSTATKQFGVAYGAEAQSTGYASHAEGNRTRAKGNSSHAEGVDTSAIGVASHSEGHFTDASANYSHAEGSSTKAYGESSHAEGNQTESIGENSHAEGSSTKAYGESSHAEGNETIARNTGEHAEGNFNDSCLGKTIHSVGIGTSISDRKNAFEITNDGSAYVFGVGGYIGNNRASENSLQKALSNCSNLINITWSELKSLRDLGKLIPGAQYRITDYTTTCDTIKTYGRDYGSSSGGTTARSAGHKFDIIVVADSEDKLNENARAIQHTNNANDYFANCNLSAWELKYTIDNDTTNYEWATSNGKGVIHWMKDEFGNECYYDFKNIQYYYDHPEIGGFVYSYTFDAYNVADGSTYDATIKLNQGPAGRGFCTNNVIGRLTIRPGSGIDVNRIETLGAIMFHIKYFESGTNSNICYSNRIGFDCKRIEFGSKCVMNMIGDGCKSIEFGDECEQNIIYQSSIKITFGNNCCENTFGQNTQHITFGNNCHDNTIGQDSRQTTFGYGCTGNTILSNGYDIKIGNNCTSNTILSNGYDIKIGDNCIGNIIESDCSLIRIGNNSDHNTIKSGCQNICFGLDNDNPKDWYRNIIVENGCYELKINASNLPSRNNRYRNVKFYPGVTGVLTDSSYNQEAQTICVRGGSTTKYL